MNQDLKAEQELTGGICEEAYTSAVQIEGPAWIQTLRQKGWVVMGPLDA